MGFFSPSPEEVEHVERLRRRIREAGEPGVKKRRREQLPHLKRDLQGAEFDLKKYSRRRFGAAALSAAGLGALALYGLSKKPTEESPTSQTTTVTPPRLSHDSSFEHLPINTQFDASVERLRRTGNIVLDTQNSAARRLIICFKQMHAGASIEPLFATDVRLFSLFVQHHNNMLRAMKEEWKYYAEGKSSFVFEGMRDGDEESRKLQEIQRLEEEMAGLSNAQREEVIRRLWEKFIRNRTGGKDGSIFHVFLATKRFLGFANANGITSSVHGEAPAGFPSLSDSFMERYPALLEKEEVTLEELAAFMAWFKQASNEDWTGRNAHIVQTMERVPDGGIGMLVLGGSHFSSGRMIGDKILPDEDTIERHLQKVHDARIVVVEPQEYVTLKERMVAMIGDGITPEMSVEDALPIINRKRARLGNPPVQSALLDE